MHVLLLFEQVGHLQDDGPLYGYASEDDELEVQYLAAVGPNDGLEAILE